MVKTSEVNIGDKVWYDNPLTGFEHVVVNDCFMINISYDNTKETDYKYNIAFNTYLEKPEGTTNREELWHLV